MNAATNPRLSPAVRVFFALASLIVLAGAGLYVAPDLIMPRWVWPLTPFNANFLGAVYLTELVAASQLIWYNRWSPCRVALPMSYVFTGVVTLVSFFYLDRFDWGRWVSYFWFFIYIGSVLFAAGAHYVYRRLPVAQPLTLAANMRSYLLALGAFNLILGLLLLLAPATGVSFWPWRIDGFHGRIYSAFFLSGAAGYYMLLRGAARLEIRVLGLAQTAAGLLPILGLIVVDASAHRVQWTAAGTLLWLLLFMVMLGGGVYLLWKSAAVGRDITPLGAPS